MLSVVIPTLNAAQPLETTLEAISAAGGEGEVIIADGGSTDATRSVAERTGAKFITIPLAVPRGRGAQLAAGAKAASGEWLLFLHADTVLAAGWRVAAARFMDNPDNAARAAVFRFALDDAAAAARRLERWVAWRNRALGLAWGDQGLLICRPFYDRLGGFKPMPLMEDVDLARRIGKKRLVVLDAAAVTSAERYRRGGYLARPLRNLFCLSLYYLGVPPGLILKVYR